MATGPTLALALLGGYLLGAVPFGLILTRIAGLGDIRAIGSGNIGATNVLRTGRKGIAAATLLLDGFKGAAAVLFGAWLAARMGAPVFWGLSAAVALAGFGAVLGHLFPVWLGFKGGKGVATTFGVLVAACWPAGLAALVLWLATALIGRYSSLAALVSMVAAPILGWVIGGQGVGLFAAVLAVLVIARHKGNIARLVRGEDPRIGRA
jgi:glycerol-3-phosphate acyltransferase PlsY